MNADLIIVAILVTEVAVALLGTSIILLSIRLRRLERRRDPRSAYTHPYLTAHYTAGPVASRYFNGGQPVEGSERGL